MQTASIKIHLVLPGTFCTIITTGISTHVTEKNGAAFRIGKKTTMENQQFKIIFKGEIAPGANIENVKQKLAKAFRADREKIDALFTGKPKVIKKNASRAVCEKTKKIFTYAGAVCEVVPKNSAVTPQPSTPEPEISDSGKTSIPDVTQDTDVPKKQTAAPVSQPSSTGINKAVLLLLTFFLGFLGIHKFYLARYWQGAIYLLFSWTFIPGLAAVIEFVRYAVTDEKALQSRYTTTGNTPLVVLMAVIAPFVFLALLVTIIGLSLYFFVFHNTQDMAALLTRYLSSQVTISGRVVSGQQTVAGTFSRPTPTAETPADNQVTGQINGTQFVVDTTEIRAGILHLKQGRSFFADREIIIFPLLNGASLEKKVFDISPDKKGQFGIPHIHLRWQDADTGQLRSDIITSDYRMYLAFGEADENTMKGTINLELSGDTTATVSGSFTALIRD